MDQINRARYAVVATFILNGITAGSFVARVPDIKRHFQLSDGQLGLLLFCTSVGVLGILTIAGRIIAKYGSKPIATISTIALALSLIAAGWLPSVAIAAIAFVFLGSMLALQDVAMNTHGITVEHESGKRYMSYFHANFSIGSFLGGVIGGFFSQQQVSFLVQGTVLAALFIFVALVLSAWWLPAHLDQHPYEEKKKTKRPRIIWLLGLLGFLAAVGEGTAGDWGGVLARDTFNASPFLSTVPYICFTVAMIAGRFSGDKLAEKYGPANLIFACGLLAGVGLASGVVVGGIGGVIFAWLALGAGVSIVIPMLFSAGGEIAKRDFPGKLAPSDGVAMVGGIAYFGFMVGPPAMGALAELLSLRWAMLVPALGCIVMALSARPLINSHK